MDNWTEVEQFARLFYGRGDVYGSNEGGCVKRPLTKEVLLGHFADAPIGVYPMIQRNGEWKVAWGCVDFDTADAHEHAFRLYNALAEAGITSWVERSRSKGYHVWVFPSAVVPAEIMRYALIVACQVAEVPTTEVNPKQVTLKDGQYGNYVRLPYARLDTDDETTNRQRIITTDDQPIPFSEFVASATSQRTPVELLERIASYYQPPAATEQPTGDYEYDATLDEAMSVLSPLGKVIWRDGPLQGKDRSTTLAKLGHECVRSGLNPSQTRTVIRTADQRWGKYHMRPNGELEIDKLVVRVHS
jgi:hypothetical protein